MMVNRDWRTEHVVSTSIIMPSKKGILKSHCLSIHLGPVVQSIVSLTKSLVSDSLSLLVRLKSSVLIFFAEKMAVFLCIICLKFEHHVN